MNTILYLLLCLLILSSCQNNQPSYKADTSYLSDTLQPVVDINKMVQEETKKALIDTQGVSSAPVRIISAKLVKEEYSNYKSVQLTFKNVSGKRIEAIKFKWYGEDAFGEPADMGSYIVDGMGGGFDDDPLSPGRTNTSTWSILSSRAKKIIVAWPYEIAFSDGTKWSLEAIQSYGQDFF